MDEEYISDFFKINIPVVIENKHESTKNALDSPVELLSQNSSSSSDGNIHNSQENEIENLHLSQLEIEVIEPLTIPPFFNISPRTMPISPHYAFEEEFSSNPWILLIATIFLSKTNGKTARPFMRKFFEQYPTPYDVLDENPTNLETFFENLGLKKRGPMIWKMTYQFLSAKWLRASDLFGIGKYGEDAYRIFILGHTDLDPGDRYLRLYLDWLRGQTSYLEDRGIEDCELLMEDPVLKYYSVTLRDVLR